MKRFFVLLLSILYIGVSAGFATDVKAKEAGMHGVQLMQTVQKKQ